MRLNLDDYKLMLLELIYETTKISRFYRGRILSAPVYIEDQGWGLLCQAVEVAAEHARRILASAEREHSHQNLDLDLPPIPALPPISDNLAEKMRVRAAVRGENIVEAERARSEARAAHRARLH